MKNWDNRKFVLAFIGYFSAFAILFLIYFSGYFIHYYKYEAFSRFVDLTMICVIFKIIVSTIANDPIITNLPDNEVIRVIFQKLANNIQIIKPIVWIIAITIKLSFIALAIWALMWKLKN